jgi:predicted ArsR family transcriptional regulator
MPAASRLEKLDHAMETRARVEAALTESPHGLDAAELAERLGIHPNTARWHLGALAADGRVSSATPARAGRGRPRVVYRAEPARQQGTGDEYRLLATVLGATLAGRPDGPMAVEGAGREWGRYLTPRRLPLVYAGDDEARVAVTTLLAEQGFRPELVAGELRMRRCPFRDLAEARPEIVCAMHRGLIDGALGELGSDLRVSGLDVFVEPGLCIVRLTSGPSGPSSPAASACRA